MTPISGSAHPSAIVNEDDEVPAPHRIDLRAVGSTWLLPTICIVFGPALAYFAYGVSPFYIQNGVDPFIYAGYTFDPSDLITRYGYTYFSVRFGLLIPSELSSWVFGVSTGYFALRWFAISAAIAVVIIWCKRIGAPQLGWLAGTIFVVNPIVIRAVMTVYTDTVGVPYLLAAFALLLTPGSNRTRTLASLGAGVLIGLTAHVNLWLAIPLGGALVVWSVVRIVVARRQALFEMTAVTISIAAVTAAGALYYKLRFGRANVLTASIDAARKLEDLIPADVAPDRHWLNFRPFLFIPPLAVLCLIAVLLRRRMRPQWFEVAAIGMMLVVIATYIFDEFLTNGYFMETYFYTSFFIGPTTILVVLCVRRMLIGTTVSRWGALVAAGSIVVFPFIWKVALSDLQVWTIFVVPILLVAIVGLVWSTWRLAPVAAATVLALTPVLLTLANPHDVPLAAGQPYRREPFYERSMFNPDEESLERYVLASRFMEVVPNWSSAPGSVLFWYPSGDDTANLMGSTFLWLMSNLTVTGPGMPVLDARTAAHLQERTPRFLVLVASRSEDVDAGALAIRTAVIPKGDTRHEVHSGKFALFVNVLELNPGSCDLATKGTNFYWEGMPPC